jgi:acyl carrier protein
MGEPANARQRALDEKGLLIMDRTSLRQIMREMVENNTGEPLQHFDDDTDIRSGLGLDSVDVITLAIEIQERLKVVTVAADFEQLQTVGDLIGLILARIPSESKAA